MRNIFIVILILCHFLGHAQGRKIMYIFPDSVEVRIYNHMQKELKAKQDNKHYFFLRQDTIGLYSLTIVPFKDSDQTQILSWVNGTNRYALVNDTSYPILLDYDFRFSTPDLRTGDFGHRDGNIRKLHLLAHGYTIYFRTNGLILKEVYW
jgi:hypothetical protein